MPMWRLCWTWTPCRMTRTSRRYSDGSSPWSCRPTGRAACARAAGSTVHVCSLAAGKEGQGPGRHGGPSGCGIARSGCVGGGCWLDLGRLGSIGSPAQEGCWAPRWGVGAGTQRKQCVAAVASALGVAPSCTAVPGRRAGARCCRPGVSGRAVVLRHHRAARSWRGCTSMSASDRTGIDALHSLLSFVLCGWLGAGWHDQVRKGRVGCVRLGL